MSVRGRWVGCKLELAPAGCVHIMCHTQQYCQYTIVRQIVGVIKRKHKNTGNCNVIIIVIIYWYTNFAQQFNPLEMLPDDLRQLSRGSILARGCRKIPG